MYGNLLAMVTAAPLRESESAITTFRLGNVTVGPGSDSGPGFGFVTSTVVVLLVGVVVLI